MALAVTPRGETLVLDQVNGRIARWDASGAPLAPWPLDLRTPRDLAAGPRGEVAVLDPGAGRVVLLGPDGAVRASVPVGGSQVADPALATGVTLEPSGVWAEISHAWNVSLADSEGHEIPRGKRDGKASRDGASWLSAGIAEAKAGTAWVRAVDPATGGMRWQRRYAFPAPILRLALLDSFADGRIAFAAHVAREAEPGRFEDESVEVLCLAADGAFRSSISFPPPEGPEEAMRELAVAPDGVVVYLYRTRSGARLMRGDCR